MRCHRGPQGKIICDSVDERDKYWASTRDGTQDERQEGAHRGRVPCSPRSRLNYSYPLKKLVNSSIKNRTWGLAGSCPWTRAMGEPCGQTMELPSPCCLDWEFWTCTRKTKSGTLWSAHLGHFSPLQEMVTLLLAIHSKEWVQWVPSHHVYTDIWTIRATEHTAPWNSLPWIYHWVVHPWWWKLRQPLA